MKKLFMALVMLSLTAGANAQLAQSTLPNDYAGVCVTQVIGSIAMRQESAQIKIVIDPIADIAKRYNITCLRRIINISTGGLGLGLPNPWQALNSAVCSVLGG